jgi:inosine/xanthosine triphosphatase
LIVTPGKLIVHVGSTNPVKLAAVRETFQGYDAAAELTIVGREVSSGVSDQPVSLDETIRGAINRARNAFHGCDLSVGLEDGLVAVPYTQSGYMNICACVIFDSRREFLGLSSAFEYPVEVVRLIIEEGLDVTRAFRQTGLSDNPALGSAEGAIGILTKGRLTRTDYTKQAVATALIHYTPFHS